MIGAIPQSPFAFKHLSKEGHELSWASISMREDVKTPYELCRYQCCVLCGTHIILLQGQIILARSKQNSTPLPIRV